jgi:hypothetical protein
MPFYHEPDVLGQTRAQFISKGTTLTDWCRANKLDTGRVWRVLQGKNLGPKGLSIRKRVMGAALDQAGTDVAA